MNKPREREIADACLRLAPDDPAEFVKRACAGDSDLERRVLALLVTHSHSAPVTPTEVTVRSSLGDPDVIGSYRIVHRVGEGGMGVVYVAEQTHPVRRRVALKIIKLGMDTTDVIARFESERQALALMSHPNIARILDAGATDEGRPYFVMEYVPGVPITEYCDIERMRVDDRVRLFIQVCRAVEHAHNQGVIHRDLKPTNILVSSESEEPTPKVIDFGIAKAINRQLADTSFRTELGRPIGTPEYMSPEQAAAGGVDVDRRTDVYSLGVVLYELLVGVKPFDFRDGSKSYVDIHRIVTEITPTLPSVCASRLGDRDSDAVTARAASARALVRSLRRDLDWIVMKTLEKERERRYESPARLAEDLDRYLNGRPVIAGPPNPAYRVRKWIGRNRAAVITAAAVVVALIAATVEMLRVTGQPELAARSVAILPLAEIASVENERLVADGLHESIITQLSKIGDLSVISRTSVMPYRGATVSAEDVGRELNVATVLQGTVRHAGEQLRVAVQLVRTRDGVQVWADQYDVPYAVEEVFAIQSDIAERIASALNATLSAAEREQIRAEPTTSLEALEAYYRGNAAYEGRYEQAEAERAVDAYQEAVRLDPTFGLAYAALAQSRVWLAWQFAAGDAEIAAAEAALERAVALAPRAFQTLIAQGQVRYRADRNYDAALASFQQAIELAPSDFSGHMSVGSIHRRLGEWEQAIAQYERAAALSPRDPTLLYTLGHTNHLARRFEEAGRWFRNLAAVSPRTGPQGPVFGRFELLLSMGDTATARQLVNQIPDSEHGARDRLTATLAFFGREFELALAASAPLQFVPLAGEIDRELSDAMIYHAMGDSASVRLMAESDRLRGAAELEGLALAHPNQLSGVYGRLGLAHALLGNRVAALQAGDLGIRSLPLETDAYTGRFGLQRMALIRLYLGDFEDAIELLEQLADMPSEITPELLRLDPRWDPLRGNPRFDALAEGRTPPNP